METKVGSRVPDSRLEGPLSHDASGHPSGLMTALVQLVISHICEIDPDQRDTTENKFGNERT